MSDILQSDKSQHSPEVLTRVILNVIDGYLKKSRGELYRQEADLAAAQASHKARKETEDRYKEREGDVFGFGHVREPDFSYEEKQVVLLGANVRSVEDAKAFLIDQLLIQFVKPKAEVAP